MQRRISLVFIIFFLVILSRHGASQSGSQPTFDPAAAQLKRGYFAQLPFEQIDMVNGNLLLSFTDLVLPGNAGMDLRLSHYFNKQANLWRFGLDGVPMRVLEANAFQPPCSNGFCEDRHHPTLFMASGLQRVTTPINSLDATDIWITPEFARYTLATRTVDLPNGWTATYSNDANGALGLLQQVQDVYGNQISVQWETVDLGTFHRPTAFIQTIGSDTREVDLTYDIVATEFPSSMTYNGREWRFDHSNDVDLSSVSIPGGGSWGFDYSNGLTVTTPQGGTVYYDFTPQSFPDDSGGPPRNVVSVRTVGGRAVPPATWNLSYSPQTGSQSGSFGTVAGPQGLTFTFRHDWSGLDGEWLLSETSLSSGSAQLSDFRRQYQFLRFLPWQSTGTIAVPQLDTLVQDGQTYTKSYEYNPDDSDNHFADFHRPRRISGTGQLTKTIDKVFEYGFDPGLYLLDRTRSETLTVNGESFARSYGYEASTGFMNSENMYGVTATYSRDGAGNRQSATDANNNQTTFSHRWGVLENTNTPEYAITREINPDGTVASETRGGIKTMFAYDGIGRTTLVRAPNTDDMVTDYTDETHIVVTRGPTQTVTTVDGFGRVTGTSNAEGVQTRASYDEVGQKVFQSYPYDQYDPSTGSATTGDATSHDGLGRTTRVTHSDGSFIRYDYSGTDVAITDEIGHVTAQHWEVFGDPTDRRLTAVTDAARSKWTYTYNAIGSLTSVSGPDGSGRSWSYYPGTNLLADELHPESGNTHYTYYPNGSVQSKSDSVHELDYTYDRNDRLRHIATSDGVDDVDFGYDDFDNRIAVTNTTVQSTFHYDATRLRSRTDTILGQTFQTAFDYDGRNNIIHIGYPSGRNVYYSYDYADRITEVRGNSQPGLDVFATNVHYHPSGQVRQYSYGNGLTENVGFDGRGRVSSIVSGPLNLSYDDVDTAGNIKHITDARSGFSSGFGYDELDRLTSVSGFGSRGFTYDAVGNRRTMTAGAATITYHYDDGLEHLTGITDAPTGNGSFAYDDVGNMTGDPSGSTYTYSSFNMMTTATNVAGAKSVYSYDGSNARTVRSTPDGVTWSIHGAGSQLLADYDATSGEPQLLREYIYLGAKLLTSIGRGVVQPPLLSVRITSPNSGDSSPNDEPVTLTAAVTSNLPNDSVAQVEFYHDGILIGTATSTGSGYSLDWTSNLPAGTYSVIARVVMQSGVAMTSAPINIKFFLVGRVTGVRVTPDPLNVGDTATVTVTGNLNECGAVGIDFGDGDAQIWPYDQALGVAPFERTHVWTSGGPKTVIATGHGNCRGTITTTVTPRGPHATITTPANGARLLSGDPIPISATAGDDGGVAITRVDFYADGAVIGSVPTDPSNAYSITWTGAPVGPHTLTARAYNANGVFGISAPVSVFVSVLGSVIVDPATVPTNQPATVTVTGRNPCGALMINFGPGGVDGQQTFPINGLPYQHVERWTTAGTKTITVTGEGAACAGQITGSVTVIVDNPPTVALTRPAAGSYLAPATFTLTATAGDSDGTIARVDFYAGATLIGSSTTQPYQVAWNSVPHGTYSLTAVAVDNLGASTTSSPVSVTVTDILGVGMSPSTPHAGAAANVTVTGSAACNAVQIDYGDGSVLQYSPVTLPYTAAHAWASPGTFTVVATGVGSCSGSATTGVTVVTNVPPTVSLTSPSADATFSAPATVSLAANAADSDGTVTRVDFYANGTLIGSSTSAPYGLTWTSVAAGVYSLTAIAYDNAGASTTSAAVAITVTNLTSVTVGPSSVATNVPATVTVTGGNPCGALQIDFGPGAADVPQTYPISGLPFQHTETWSTAGTKTITVTGQANCVGTITGQVTVIANNPPSVTLTSPANGSTFAAGSNIALAATASDSDGTVNRVEFYAGSTLLATSTAAPYTFTWVNPAAGSYSLTAQAVDNLGARTISAAASVTVSIAVTGVSASPASVVTGQSTTVTVTGSTACGALQIDFGPGAADVPQTYPISGLPFQKTETWSTGGTKTITVTGQGGCIGTVTGQVTVIANNPPAVSLTSPANGSTFAAGSNFVLSATASDSDGTVNRVEFYAGSTLLATSTAAPYTYTWVNPAPGSYSLTAQAVDNLGARTISTAASVTVSIAVTGLSASPASVLSGQSSVVTVTGSSTCGAVQIDFGAGASVVPQVYAISGLPFQQTVSWSTGGTKTITATGQGNCGGQVTGTVTVTANNPPSVTLTSPANGSTFAAPATITLAATASDSDGSVARVEFHAGSTLLGTATSAPYTFSWVNPALGTYSLTAQAVDNLGLRAVSAAASVTVANLVTGVSASPASVVTGQSTTVTVSGSSTCGAVGIDFGPGASRVPQVYAISSLPFSVGVSWSSAGTKTIVATGNAGCGGQVSGTVSVTTDVPPSVTLTSPANGSAYTSGTAITLSASASDSDGVAHVDFYVDSTLIGSVASAPYNRGWSVLSGTHSITAVAYDIYGASTTSTAASVSVRDVVSVSVSPASLTAGDTATVTVTGSASCGAVTIDYGDGTVITYAISGLPISQSHAWSAGGSKTITATGQAGCVGQASTSVYVNWPPSVTLTAPVNGNTYVGPATIAMSASASDPDGSIASVTFYANGTPLSTSYTAPYSFSWTTVPVGNYSIWAVATDNAGVARGSNVSAVSVQDPGPSTVTSVVMSSQTVSVGQAALIEVFGTNPCGAVQVNTGDGNAPFLPISSLPYYEWYAWGAPGVYTVTITGEANCHGQASTTITVVGEPPTPAQTSVMGALSPVEVERQLENDDVEGPHGPHVDDNESGSSSSEAPPSVDNVTLTVNLIGNGAGTVTTAGLSCHGNFGLTCTVQYPQGTVLTLANSPDTGSQFSGWGGGCTGTSCRVILNQSLLVTAAFNVPPPTVTQYYHLDAIGSVRAVTNETGALVRREDYAPFGEEVSTDEPIALLDDAKHQRFVGKERDPETSLDYSVARYYGSQWARFTTVDPEHLGGDIVDPQSWNVYAYSRNNPLRFVDPLGTDYEVDAIGGTPFAFYGSFEQLTDLASGFMLVGGRWGGDIYNANGQRVGSYTYFDRFALVLRTAGMQASETLKQDVREMVINAALSVLGAGVEIAPAIPKVANSKLANIVGAMFKGVTGPSVPIGNGSLADAIRYELQTGRKVFGRSHITKGVEYARALEKWLAANPGASRADRGLAEGLLQDLREALAGR